MLRISQEALTFDDILLVPGYSEVLPNEVSLKTRLTRGIELNIPLVSAAMDTVTEARLAIAMAQEGGIGIIHKNMTIEQQAAEVRKVKRYEAGVVKDPITIEADATVRDLFDLTRLHNISGVPVLHDGDLVGIVTSRDVRFENRLEVTVREVMTPKERLVTVKEGADKNDVRELLHKHRIERVLIVDDKFALKGMMTVNDIEKAKAYPLASKDDQGRLRVGAAVGTGKDTGDRVSALVAAGVDVVVVDTAHGHSKGVIDRVRWVKQNFPEVQVIGGNIATGAAAKALAEAGADAVKVGIGPGSICTTRIVAGVGVPQISAIANVAAALEGTGVPLIADGGIRFSGDLSKAIVAGASCVMMGSIGRVVDYAKQIRRPALQLHRDLPGGQHGLHQWLLCQPRTKLLGLGWGLRVEVQLGREALLQPVIEGVTKARGHRARTDIRGQCQQQRHQRQAQGGQLLAAVGEKPLAQHRTAAPEYRFEQAIEQHR